MARKDALEDPAVPQNIGAPQKQLPCLRKAPDVVEEGPEPDVDPKTPKAAQNTSEAPDMAAETPNPDVLWARNGHRTLLVDSDTDLEEEEGPNPDVGPPKQLKMTPNVPETPVVGLKTPNPDVSWLKNGHGTLVVESDTDVEEEEVNPDVESPKPLKITQKVSETPDVAAKTPNPDVSGPKMCCGMELVDSDTDVEEDPDVQPQKRLRVAQVVPGIPDVEVESPNPAVEAPRMGPWMLLVESDTDEENPDVQPQKSLRMTQNVPETPDVAAKTPNPDVSGPKLCHQMLLGDSDTDVENKVNPDVQPQKRLKVAQRVPRIPDVEVETPNSGVERPKIGLRTLVVDSDTDVGEDPDVEPLKRLRVAQSVPETPDEAAETPSPDVSGPEIGCRMFLVDSDTDVEEEEVNLDVEPLRKLRMTPNVPESPDVGLKMPNPDVGRTKNGCQMLLGDSDTDVEEEASPDVRPSKRRKITQNGPETPNVPSQTPNPAVEGSQRRRRALLEDSDTDVEDEANPDVGSLKRPETSSNMPETPDVRLKMPNPDVSGTRIGCGMLLGDSDTDVEEETSPDVRPSRRMKITQNMPESPDVPSQTPNPDVEGPQRGHGMLLVDSDTDVEAEADPDVWPSKRRKITQKLPETPGVGPTPPNPDVGRLQGTQNTAKIPDVEGKEEGQDLDVATQLFPPPNQDVGVVEADPDVGSPKQLKITQNQPEIPDMEEKTCDPDMEEVTPDPDVEEEEESDPDVATQLFLPSPDVGSPESPRMAPKAPKISHVGGLPSLDPDVATQLFLPPDPDVENHPNPDALGPQQPNAAPNDPRIPDVTAATPNPDVEVEEDFDVATQLFLPPNPDLEGEGPLDPDVRSLQTPKTPLHHPKIPDVEVETSNPDVEGPGVPCPDPDVATQLFLSCDADVQGPLDTDVGSPKTPKSPTKLPKIPSVKAETPNPDVEGPGWPCPDPDVATQRFLPPDPDVKCPESPETALNEPHIPDVEGETPDPDVAGDPGPTQEDAEALPTPQVRRSQRLAESRGGGASSGPTPTQVGRDQAPKPRPSPKPRPHRRDRAGRGLVQATPPVSVKGDGRGSGSALPPQEEEPAQGAKRSLRPRAPPGPAHIRVLFTGLVASPALLVALGTLGGTEATSVRDCSHLVTDGIRRTLKFLCALGRGIPIVTPQWLLESSQCGRPLSPGPFLPRDPPRERRFGFRLRPALARARARPLLQGYQVHVTPSVQPCPEDMRDIVTCCGGTFLPQLPREHAPRVLVISCPQDRSLWAPAVAARLPLLSAELLLSGVLWQRLDIARFLLTPLNPPNPPLKNTNPSQKAQNPIPNPKSPARKHQNPAQKTPNPTQKTPNPTPKAQNPARNTPTPPRTPPPSPPRTRSRRRPPQNPLPKPSNSGTPQKSPNPPKKTLKRPRGPSEGPDSNFGVPDPPQEPPRTRSHRGPSQNPSQDPSNSGTPQKTPKQPQKPPNPPKIHQNAPKQPRGPNPNFGVAVLPPAPPQELPRTRSGQRHPPNSGTSQKSPNPPPKAPKRLQNASNPTQNRSRGPPDGPEPPLSPPRTRSRRGPPRDPPKNPKPQ